MTSTRLYNFNVNNNITFYINIFLYLFSTLLNIMLIKNYNPIDHTSVTSFFGYVLIVDSLSLWFILLNSMVFLLCSFFLSSTKIIYFKLKSMVLLSIHVLLFLAFTTTNFLCFYIFFEALLIPMFILINVWGSRGRRMHASYLFFFFTFGSSIFLVSGILYLYISIGSLCFFDFMYISKPDFLTSSIILYLFFFGFMAKIPTIPFHIWLPEAHVEAPTIGSVILASIILKLGYYGFARILVVCDPYALHYHSPIFITFLVVSVLYSSIMALRQIDLKKIIAYSSIAHMNFGMLGLFSESQDTIVDSIFIMFSHGLISAGMFFGVGMLYDRFHTRNIMYYGGLIQHMPIFGILFFIIMFSNLSLPGTCNFIGEVGIYVSFGSMPLLLLLLLSGTVPLTLFCIFVLVKILFYQSTGFLTSSLRDLFLNEFLILAILCFFIILFGLFPNTFFFAYR